jgi:adenylosuccinate synthase
MPAFAGRTLSLYHSQSYPKTTSRDTSAAGCLSECGISPRLVTDIVLVLRTFPIRVAGQQAGPMFEEIDWQTVQRESGYPHELAEFTTVTGKLRRVGRFDFALVRRAVAVNRPTHVALNFLDYVSFEDRSARSEEELTNKAYGRLAEVQQELGVPVRYAGVGPTLTDTFEISTIADAGRSRLIRGRELHGCQRSA